MEKYIQALEALKMQAHSVTANDFKGDKKSLQVAQKSMKELEPYTKVVYRLLMGNKEGVNIDTADNAWLERALSQS